MLRQHLPDLKVRVVNVVDLMRLQPDTEHPHGMSDTEFDSLFTRDKPIVFAYHGYPWLIHRLTYRRTNHANIHVRGYKEEGTTTTPFDMVMLNDLDRFHLVIDVIDRVPGLGPRAGARPPADGRPAPASAAPTRGWRARTRRRSATGPGRTDGPASRADPRRQRGLQQPEAAGPRPGRPRSWRRRTCPRPAGRRTSSRVARGHRRLRRRRRGRPPDRPRRDAVRATGPDRRARSSSGSGR